jgi:signal transduction histidine kinase
VWQHQAMRGREVRLAIGVGGTIWALAAEWIALDGGGRPSAVLLNLAIGLTYLYGGLAIWARAPANRTGAKMTAVGLTWFIGAVAGAPIPFVGDLGLAFGDLSAVFLLTLVLAYPGGTLETTIDRIGIAIMLVGTTTINVVNDFVTNPLLINQGTNGLYVGLALALMASALVVRRWVLAPAMSRRDLTPVLVAGGVFIATVLINIVRRIADVPDTTAELLIAIKDLAPAAVPVALLIGFYGQSERRLRALVDAIPDPLFRIGRDGRLVETMGAAVEEDDHSSEGQDGQRLQEALQAAQQSEALAAAARAVDERRLQSLDITLELPEGRRELEVRLAPSGHDEVTAIVRDFTDQREAEAEVRRSRARIVEAGDAERRRIERNLHDGAQQRLVALSLALRRARAQVSGDGDGDATTTLDEAGVQLRAALDELRELARGIHPAILTEAGLGPALGALAAESPVDVTLDVELPEPLPGQVEAAAYFVVAEALTNVAKYAAADHVAITATTRDGVLQVEVGDDGRGGADPAAGTGLRGLEDRVAALGGRLAVRSPAGGGTQVMAQIPIEEPAGVRSRP